MYGIKKYVNEFSFQNQTLRKSFWYGMYNYKTNLNLKIISLTKTINQKKDQQYKKINNMETILLSNTLYLSFENLME